MKKQRDEAGEQQQRVKEGDLTGGVPYGDVVGPPLLEEKRPSDGADGVFELPLRVPVEQRRLPHVHVPQQDDLHVGLLHLRPLGHDDAGRSGGGSLSFVVGAERKKFGSYNQFIR